MMVVVIAPPGSQMGHAGGVNCRELHAHQAEGLHSQGQRKGGAPTLRPMSRDSPST